jgi:hypothetical protein
MIDCSLLRMENWFNNLKFLKFIVYLAKIRMLFLGHSTKIKYLHYE